MATIRIFLGILCLTALGSTTMPDRGVLKLAANETTNDPFHRVNPPFRMANTSFRRVNNPFHWVNNRFRGTRTTNPIDTNRSAILKIARAQIGVREASGHNDGAAVEKYLHYTGNRRGEAWCASFISWIYGQAGFKAPRTAWSAALFPLGKRIQQPQPADLLAIYSASLKRIAHCGIVEQSRKHWIISIEGNTNNTGSREGDGVYRKWRHQRTIYTYADWLKGKELRHD